MNTLKNVERAMTSDCTSFRDSSSCQVGKWQGFHAVLLLSTSLVLSNIIWGLSAAVTIESQQLIYGLNK